MAFTPFTLQTLIRNIPLGSDGQQNTNQNPGGILGWSGRDGKGGTTSSRLTSGISWGNKDNKVVIEAVEAWENNLYIGTSDGNLLHYVVDDQISPETGTPYEYLVSKKLIFGKRIVEKIVLFPQIMKAVIFYSTLSFFSLPEMEALPATDFPLIKGVTCFSHDLSMEGKTEKDGSVKICAIKKRSINIFSLNNNCVEEENIQLPDGAITACQYGQHLLVADNYQYNLINLRAKHLDNLMPYIDSRNDRNSPIGADIFKPIVTTTIGQFVLSNGDPVRGILQWTSFPRAIGVDYPYVVALLRNNTIEIHNIIDQKLVQTVTLRTKAKTISTGPGIKVQPSEMYKRLKLENRIIGQNKKTPSESGNSKVINKEIDNIKSSLNDNKSEINTIEQNELLTSEPTRLIISGVDSVIALAATPLILQADYLLDSNRFEEALSLAEQAMNTTTPEITRNRRINYEINYIYQKSGYIFLGETLLDDAFSSFEKGKTDPRILIQLFPDLEDIIGDDEVVQVFSGIGSLLDDFGSFEDIDIETASATQGLRKTLITNAKENLQKYLSKYREQFDLKAISKDEKKILQAVDNALVRLFIENNSDKLLNSLLEGPNYCDLGLSEQILINKKKSYSLLLLYQKNNEFQKALELWHSLLSEKNPKIDYATGLEKMVDLLGKLDDKDLVMKYAIINELRIAGCIGLKMYLEYLVTKRKINEFSQQSKDTTKTFLSFLLSQPIEDLISQERVKLIAFLQTSTQYNLDKILNKLLEVKILKAELAIIYGKLSEHEKALNLLINDLRDYNGAEIYCIYGGNMIGIINKSSKKQADKIIKEDKNVLTRRKSLFLMLLNVYLENGNEMVDRIISLLNKQAIYLDLIEVLSLLPEYWSIEMFNEFLVKSIRKDYHEYREGQILKSICHAYQEIGPIVITQNVKCTICEDYISGSDFLRKTNSDLVHLKCENPNNENDNNNNLQQKNGNENNKPADPLNS
ncbi:15928_t:CDS:10 [Entrophospora sp. SA101]|nr:15928_t:CDS:10 [Entrophospora sp. SA101]